VTLVDTNVLRDVLGADPEWLPWSVDQLRQRRLVGQLLINDITYAELAVRVATEVALNAALAELGVRLERTPVPALFLAGKAFGRYRAAGGPRPSLLADFFIGAHAQVSGLRLLTRDPRRYRSYFPEVELITPEG
jgi:predicted nucleic acid-binding protein